MQYRDEAGSLLALTTREAVQYLNFLANPRYDDVPFYPPILAFRKYSDMKYMARIGDGPLRMMHMHPLTVYACQCGQTNYPRADHYWPRQQPAATANAWGYLRIPNHIFHPDNRATLAGWIARTPVAPLQRLVPNSNQFIPRPESNELLEVLHMQAAEEWQQLNATPPAINVPGEHPPEANEEPIGLAVEQVQDDEPPHIEAEIGHQQEQPAAAEH